jgi:serralysin
MFNVNWFGIGVDSNYGSLRISGDTVRYTVQWGEGPPETIRTDRDDDDDEYSTTQAGHGFSSDGTYLISVTQVGAGLPPERLRAFMYRNATNDVTIAGNNMKEMMIGGYGNDDLRGYGADDTIRGNEGTDRLYGGDGDDFVLGDEGNDAIYGGAGDDLIVGGLDDDRLFGGVGSDSMYGEDGDDVLQGGEGADYLIGGAGTDRLVGGAGGDTFTFAPVVVEGVSAIGDAAIDMIVDFEQETDRIDVNDWFGDNFSFIGTDRFSGNGEGELRYVIRGSNTLVTGDIDGNGTMDFSFRIAGSVELQASDFGVYSF